MKVLCTRKEDEVYYQGPFWIIADRFIEIHRGHFELVGEKFACDYEGNYLKSDRSKSMRTHKKIWQEAYSVQYGEEDYTYYPRGRVAICDGVAFIHINSRCNIPSVIDRIIQEYGIAKLEVEIDLNDTYQGSHYNFQLK